MFPKKKDPEPFDKEKYLDGIREVIRESFRISSENPIGINYNPIFVRKLIAENKKLKENFPEYEVITDLYKQLQEKDRIIEEISKSFKETCYQLEKKILDLSHTADVIGFTENRYFRMEEENKFMKGLLKQHYEMLKSGKPYESVFTEKVVEKLYEGDEKC